MKLAATRALAALTKEEVPDAVRKAYGVERLRFGPEYLIPKPFDSRVLIWEASAVAEAAMASGVARRPVDLAEYREQLERRLGREREVMRVLINRARRDPKRVVFPEGQEEKVLRAAQQIVDEGFAQPILLGRMERIAELLEEHGLHLSIDRLSVVDPRLSPERTSYAEELYRLRQRRGVTLQEAEELVLDPTVFASLMVRAGDADALVAGVAQHYPETLRPALQLIKPRSDVHRVAGLYLLVLKDRVLVFGDTTVNIDPSAEDLAEIAVLAAEAARRFGIEPRVAMLSFSNFGSVTHPFAEKVRRATELVHERAPELVVDGEMQADTAVRPDLLAEVFPFNSLRESANVLIFPSLESANVAYKLVHRLGGAEAIGPILVGMAKPVQLLQHGCEVKDIVNMTAIAVLDAQGE